MYLKKLILQGFKSFPEKIVLSFTKGITSVVGPNGSGKSNISDAVRWVLGEQSVKNLRGGKMEDFIFAGTETRKPLGFAEVSMVIDNEDFKLPMDFSEITITRRVFRSGESEYKINNVSCRLKDIHELFMDTGIGKEGYSIIGQGRIDEILNSKGDGRRLLFEEATGIVKFRTRRDETLVKIEKERENLNRVEDIICELESKIEPLFLESEKAKKYIELVDNLKKARVNIFLIDVQRTEKTINEFEVNIKNIDEEIILTNNKKIFLENQISNLKEAISQISLQFDSTNGYLAELRSKIEQKENDILLVKEKNTYITREIERLENETEKDFFQTEKLNSEKEELIQKLNEFHAELKKSEELLDENQQEFDRLNEEIKERENTIEEFNTEIIELYKKETELNGALNNLNAMYDGLEERKEQLNDLKNENKVYWETYVNEEKNNDEELSKIVNEQSGIKEKLEFLETSKTDFSNKLNVVLSEKNQVSLKINETSSKLNIIRELKEDFEGYYASVKAILKEKQNNKNFSFVHGALGELIDVPQELETAIEIALGGTLQNIVTTNENGAKQAIDFLKRTNKGRATFLPLNVIRGKKLQNEAEIMQNASANGIVGIASDLVNYEKTYENIILNALGKTVICDTIDNAIALSRKYKNSFRIVTMNGELLNVGGSMSGGSISKKTTNIFGRGRQLQALEEEYTTLNGKLKSIVLQENDLNFEINKVSESYNKNNLLYQENETKLRELKENEFKIKEKLNSFKEKEETFAIEDKQLMEQIFHTNKDLREKENGIEDIKNAIIEHKKKLEDFQSLASAELEDKDIRINKLMDIKVLISSLTENVKSTEVNIKKVDGEMENKRNEKISKENSVKSQNEKLSQNEELTLRIQKEKEELLNNQKDKTDEISKIVIKRNELNEDLTDNEKEEKELLEKFGLLEKEKTKLDMRKEQVSEKRKNLFDTMWNDYEITYQQALRFKEELETKESEKNLLETESQEFETDSQKENLNEENINELYKKESAIKNEIKNLGQVNPGSIDEYKETKERFEFLSSQRDDIAEAEEKLKSLIKELTDLMSKQFLEQFELISKNFNEVFSNMFEGGEAYLKLADETNILQSPIEIIAKPPGKKLQNMNLLSGGERALTAIALLFGILIMKPSPFCILDEIEAALDEANVARFANFIVQLKKEIQFIVITHRKGTMEVADVLYGVTMEEHGVSKMVSVELKSLDLD